MNGNELQLWKDAVDQLKRIAEALEALALKADPEFQPKSVDLLMRPRQPRQP